MPTQKLTTEIITAAIEGFESQKTRIDQQIAELRSLLTGGPDEIAATPGPAKRKRRKMSAAARAKSGSIASPAACSRRGNAPGRRS